MKEQQTPIKNPVKSYRKKKLYLWKNINGLWKWLIAVGITIGLAYLDYQAMYNLFFELTFKDEAITYAILFAFGLEGIPFLGAGYIAQLWLKIKTKNNDKRYASIAVVMTVAGLVLVFGMAIYLRMVQIRAMGGIDAFLTAEEWVPGSGEMSSKYPEYIIDMFLCVSPIITSILAFLASWTVQEKDTEKELKKNMKQEYDEYLYREALFMEVWQELQNTREALWSSITQFDNLQEMEEVQEKFPVPIDADIFREECYRRFRQRLISNCMEIYPDQIKDFQGAVEECLSEYLLQMQKCSTIPEILENIQLKDVINEFDQTAKERKREQWEFECVKDQLLEEFRRLIDNSTVVAQGYSENKGKEI